MREFIDSREGFEEAEEEYRGNLEMELDEQLEWERIADDWSKLLREWQV